MSLEETSSFNTIKKTILFVFGLTILLYAIYKIRIVILLFFGAFIVVIVLNVLVTKLEKKGIKRLYGTILVLFGILIILGLISWLVIPILIEQIIALGSAIPGYTNDFYQKGQDFLSRYPMLNQKFANSSFVSQRLFSSVQTVLSNLINYTFSFLMLLFF